MPMMVTTALATNTRLLNSSSLISGDVTRRSMNTKAIRKTTATTKPPITGALVQPSSAPWITPYNRANSAIAMVS